MDYHDNYYFPYIINMSILKWKKIRGTGFSPFKASPKSAGFDLKSAYDYIIPAKGKEIIKTDLQICVPEGTYGRIAPRSGLAANFHIDVGAGVIDEDYRGELKIILFNHSNTEFLIEKGKSIAQLICEKIEYPILEECNNLPSTIRGSGGFGQSSIKNGYL